MIRSSRLVLVIALVGVVALASLAPAPREAGLAKTPTLNAEATAVTVSYAGLTPTVLGLTWTQTGDVCFQSYTEQYSFTSSNGPWTTLGTITTASQTWDYIYGMTPGVTSWWQIIDTDCIGSQTSNQLQVNEPPEATLAYTRPTSTSVQFTWNNQGSYAGHVAFGSYQLMESIAGGGYGSVTTITVQNTMTYTVQGLSPATLYAFYLTTTDQCSGCGATLPSSSNSNAVSFTTVPPLTAQASASSSATDVGLSLTFTCVASGGQSPYTYAWTFGDGSTGNGASVTHAYASPGSKTATCTVTDYIGTQASSPYGVTVYPAPSVTVSVNHTSAAPGSVIGFSASASGGSGSYSYSWTFGDGTSGSGAATSHKYSQPGTYTATVTITDSVGGAASGSKTLSIAYLVVTASASATSAMIGDNVTFTASPAGGAGGPYTVTWSFGDGSTGTGTSAKHAYASAGTYTPTVTVADASGATNMTTLATITVQSPNPFASAGWVLYGGIAAIVIAAGVVVALLILRQRKRRIPQPQVPIPPPPPAT